MARKETIGWGLLPVCGAGSVHRVPGGYMVESYPGYGGECSTTESDSSVRISVSSEGDAQVRKRWPSCPLF